jgi:hypothetical protein
MRSPSVWLLKLARVNANLVSPRAPISVSD